MRRRKSPTLLVFFLVLAMMLPPAFARAADESPENTEEKPIVSEAIIVESTPPPQVPSSPTQAPSDSQENQEKEEEEKGEEEKEEEAVVKAETESEGTFSPYADEIEEEEAPKGTDTRVSLDLRNIEVSEALRFLAMKGGLNLAIGKSVSGRLMLLLNNVPIKDILDIILLTNGLAYDKQGEIYSIMTEAEYKERYGRKFSDARQVRLFKLEYAIPDQVFGMMEALKSDVGRVLVDQESGTALVIDTQENLGRIEEAVNALEEKRTIQVFNLKYAKAKDVEERLKAHLDAKKVGLIISDERSNQLIIQTLPERMKTIAQLIQSLDNKTKEVLLVSKIIKVSVSDDLNAEIKWEGFFRQFNVFGTKGSENFIGNHPFSPLARSGESFLDDFANIAVTSRPTQGSKNIFTENLFLGGKGEDNYELFLKFLKTLGETKVLSSPRLTVVNNQEAKIHVGEREAYVTTTTTTGQSTTSTAEQVTFVDVGIQLAVTPTINDDGYITMKIKPEISSVTRTLTTPSKNTIPIIDTSEAETTVMVKDGTSIIIAGLRRDDRTNSDKRVPFFGDLPVIGNLFRSVAKTNKRTELLVLLTPYIVTGDALVTGEPEPPAIAMKPYQDYSSLVVEKPKKVRSNQVANFFKRMFFLGHD